MSLEHNPVFTHEDDDEVHDDVWWRRKLDRMENDHPGPIPKLPRIFRPLDPDSPPWWKRMRRSAPEWGVDKSQPNGDKE